ncbi:PepSY domain-containing protein [Yunchengibacter salinarum]|uniref:PepSY domain-containing protein n=1 Tax=Yunchengibacter salinarum TaxID=3133399 RepID=UPI0035B5D193
MHKWFSRLHKWGGLLLAVQFLFWTLSGAVMSWLQLETVRSEHRLAALPPASLPAARMADLLAVAGPLDVRGLRLARLGDAALLVAETPDGPRLLDGTNGTPRGPLGADEAATLARQHVKDAPPVRAVRALDHNPVTYRGPMPAYQVVFDDPEGLVVYVSKDSARVTARRSDLWRLFDFVWMLHIMDYDQRENINNPLLMLFAATAVLFVITGVGLLFYRLRRRDFFLRPRRG